MTRRFCAFCDTELTITNSQGLLFSANKNIPITFKGKTLEFNFKFSQVEKSQHDIPLDTDLCKDCWKAITKIAFKEEIPKLKIES